MSRCRLQKEIKNAARIETPTNANFRGSSDIYNSENSDAEYFIYRNGSSITLSTISETDNNAYWYPMKVGNYYYLLSKSNTYCCLCIINNGAIASNVNYLWNLVFVGLDVPLVQQDDVNGCGHASILQIVEYCDKLSSIPSGSGTYQERISGCFNNTSPTVDGIRSHLNNNYIDSSEIEYEWYCIDDAHTNPKYYVNAITIFNNVLRHSIDINYPVILHAALKSDTDSNLNYYHYPNSNPLDPPGRHYVCLVGYFSSNGNDCYIVRDCNYDNDYFGEYVITAAEAYNVTIDSLNRINAKAEENQTPYANADKRYIICAHH